LLKIIVVEAAAIQKEFVAQIVVFAEVVYFLKIHCYFRNFFIVRENPKANIFYSTLIN
jgi:hypothetical protein